MNSGTGMAASTRKGLLKSTRPLKGTSNGAVSAKGKGPQMDAQTRPVREHTVLF